MTADAAHVAAVAEALPVPDRRTIHDARIAVETLTPLIRAQVAAEIRAERDRVRKRYESNLFTYGSAVEPGSRDPFDEAAMDALDTAARIAEGSTTS